MKKLFLVLLFFSPSFSLARFFDFWKNDDSSAFNLKESCSYEKKTFYEFQGEQYSDFKPDPSVDTQHGYQVIAVYLAGKEKRTLIGYLFYVKHDEKRQIFQITRIAIEPKYRESYSFLEDELFKRAVEEIKKKGGKQIFVQIHNENASEFYKKLGTEIKLEKFVDTGFSKQGSYKIG